MSDDETTPEKPKSRAPTWLGRVLDKVGDKADERVEKAGDKADDRVDKAYESEKGSLRAMIRYQWVLVAFLVAAVLVLAGHAVGLDIPGFGSFEAGEETSSE